MAMNSNDIDKLKSKKDWMEGFWNKYNTSSPYYNNDNTYDTIAKSPNKIVNIKDYADKNKDLSPYDAMYNKGVYENNIYRLLSLLGNDEANYNDNTNNMLLNTLSDNLNDFAKYANNNYDNLTGESALPSRDRKRKEIDQFLDLKANVDNMISQRQEQAQKQTQENSWGALDGLRQLLGF